MNEVGVQGFLSLCEKSLLSFVKMSWGGLFSTGRVFFSKSIQWGCQTGRRAPSKTSRAHPSDKAGPANELAAIRSLQKQTKPHTFCLPSTIKCVIKWLVIQRGMLFFCLKVLRLEAFEGEGEKTPWRRLLPLHGSCLRGNHGNAWVYIGHKRH